MAPCWFSSRWTSVRWCCWVPSMTTVSSQRRSRSAADGQKDILKPLIVEDYNKNMGGVDTSDQLQSYCRFSQRTVKWWRQLFFTSHWPGTVLDVTIQRKEANACSVQGRVGITAAHGYCTISGGTSSRASTRHTHGHHQATSQEGISLASWKLVLLADEYRRIVLSTVGREEGKSQQLISVVSFIYPFITHVKNPEHYLWTVEAHPNVSLYAFLVLTCIPPPHSLFLAPSFSLTPLHTWSTQIYPSIPLQWLLF